VIDLVGYKAAFAATAIVQGL